MDRRILADLAPLALVVGALMLVNTVPGLRRLAFEELVIAVEIAPVHRIVLRPFFSAYLYLFLAVASVFHGCPRARGRVQLAGRGGAPVSG